MTPISWHDFHQKALSPTPPRIVLADGEDPRVVEAAARAQQEKLASPVLIGSRRVVESLWQRFAEIPVSVLDVDEIPPSEFSVLLERYLQLPKSKGLSEADGRERLRDALTLGCLYLRTGQADGFIGGALRTTADTLRAAFSIVGLAPKVTSLFGCFFIERRLPGTGQGGLVLLADCAVIPEPSPKQLAGIAIGAAAAYRFFTSEEPRVAFLSFSTAGSAEHPLVDRVREARDLARAKAPALAIEGEWQADAALDLFTAKVKGVGRSALAGIANVLVAPDLQTGNIAYKLAQRLGGCRAVGPVLWGMAQPANDLSRGCSAEDVLDMIALTSIQAQAAGAGVKGK